MQTLITWAVILIGALITGVAVYQPIEYEHGKSNAISISIGISIIMVIIGVGIFF